MSSFDLSTSDEMAPFFGSPYSACLPRHFRYLPFPRQPAQNRLISPLLRCTVPRNLAVHYALKSSVFLQNRIFVIFIPVYCNRYIKT